MLNFLLAFIPRAIVQGIPLLFGSTGEIVTEKSGNLNLGIPGVMYVGAICGVIGSFFYEHSVPDASAMNGTLCHLIPMACCMLGSAAHGNLILFPDRDTESKSECNRTCHDYIWCWFW